MMSRPHERPREQHAHCRRHSSASRVDPTTRQGARGPRRTPVLEWVVRAARAARGLDDVIVATSTLPGDDAVADLAASLGAPVVRGSEDDVLSRYVAALDAHPADAVVRLTADCPLLDPALIDAVVAAWRAAPAHDYVSTVLVRSLPRGMDVELVTAAAL